jgi:hypothetical protein
VGLLSPEVFGTLQQSNARMAAEVKAAILTRVVGDDYVRLWHKAALSQSGGMSAVGGSGRSSIERGRAEFP